jgi:predicted acyltransferase
MATDLSTKPNRAYALDALRGFAILTMVLSGAIPFGSLPPWMYHAQVPPPDHIFNPKIAGISWVDLVFPFFLFSMGAAIPLALSRRVLEGFSKWRLSLAILYRGLLLGLFAVYIQQVHPYSISHSPTKLTWLIGLTGFLLLFPILTRLPKQWNIFIRFSIRTLGILGAILLLAFVRYPDGTGFSWHRSDIIIIILTNVAVFGSFIWLITPKNQLARLSFLGLLIAFRLSHDLGGWVQWVWDYSPKWLNWVYHFGCLQYLFIVIPGTIVGDLIYQWMKSPNGRKNGKTEELKNDRTEPTLNAESTQWSIGRYFDIVLLMIGFNLLLLIGLFSRMIWQTTLISGLFIILGLILIRSPNTATEKLIRQLFPWGVYWLILGLIFELYEGGIKKDPNTLSYFFDTSGLAIFLLIAFIVIIDVWKRKWFNLLVYNGQNPMIAYCSNGNFLMPIFFLINFIPVLDAVENFFRKLIAPSPWIGFCRGFLVTLLVAYIVSLFSKKKIFWRT